MVPVVVDAAAPVAVSKGKRCSPTGLPFSTTSMYQAGRTAFSASVPANLTFLNYLTPPGTAQVTGSERVSRKEVCNPLWLALQPSMVDGATLYGKPLTLFLGSQRRSGPILGGFSGERAEFEC